MTDFPLVLIWGLKAVPLLLAAWITTALLRHASAATRHFLWVLAIGGTLSLPAVASVVPRWELDLLSRWPALQNLPDQANLRHQRRPEPNAGERSRTERGSNGALDRPESPSLALNRPSSPAIDGDAPGASSIALERLATGLWVVGAGLILLLVLLSLWRTNRLARWAKPMAHAGVIAQVERLARGLDLRRRVTILEAAGDTMPMTWGALRPQVLLPAGFAGWPAARRQAVLVHELAHVKRMDWLTQLVARFACALYWWNPLVWIAARRLREERELACDDLVLARGTVASSYAGDLLEIARTFRTSRATALAGVAMARRSQLADRLLAVLDASRVRGRVGRRSAATAVTAFSALILPLAAVAAGTAAAELPSTPTTASAQVAPPAAFVEPSGTTAEWPADPPARRDAVQQSRATLCDWSVRAGAKRSSSSTNVNDDRMSIKIVRDDCSLTVDAEGEITFSEDDRDLAGISRDGYFEIEERQGRDRRRLEITPEGAALQRRWLVDGDERPYGDEARAWLADVVLVLMRRAGFNAEARALRIFQRQGAEGLMAEIDQLQSDYVAAEYYSVLFARAELSPPQQVRLLDGAARRIRSDYELGRVMKALARRGPVESSVQQAYVRASDSLESDYEHRQALDALVRSSDLDVAALDAMLTSARRLDSDYERAELLVATARRYPTGQPLPASYLTAVTDMRSDYERRRVLDPLLSRDRLSSADRARVLAVLSTMRSDYERAEVLVEVARGGALDDNTRAPFFRAVDAMSSDHERQRVLDAVIAGPPDQATTLAVLASVRAIDSDYSKAEVLVAVARKGLETDEVRQAYLSAVEGIRSSYERDRARRAAGVREM